MHDPGLTNWEYSSARHAHRVYPDLLHLAIWRKVDARNGYWSV